MTKKTIKVSRVFDKLMEVIHMPTIVSYGGTRSGKTYSELQYLIQKALSEEGLIIRVFREDGTTCRKTITPDIREILHAWGVEKMVDFNKTEGIFTFRGTRSTLSMHGTNDPEALKGLRQDYALINECTSVDEEAFAQISYRTTQQIILDFNPSASVHWVFDLMEEDKVAVIHSTYRDNPFLTEKQIQAIERFAPTKADGSVNPLYDEYRWSVYGEGKKAVRKGRIYTNFFKMENPDEFPTKRDGALVWYGLDFGFSLDPSALVECSLHRDELYVRLLSYEEGLLITKNVSDHRKRSIEHVFEEEITKNDIVVADSSRPESIADLVASGYDVRRCIKGANSILNGIRLLKEIKVNYVYDRSLQYEIENYVWATKRDGSPTGAPNGNTDHALDAIRYCYTEMSKNYLSYKRMDTRKGVWHGKKPTVSKRRERKKSLWS